MYPHECKKLTKEVDDITQAISQMGGWEAGADGRYHGPLA